MVTQAEILDQLERLKNKERAYFKPKDYKEFMPSAIPNLPKRADTSMLTARLQTILDRSNEATQIAIIKSQNRRDYLAMREAQQRLRAAKNAAKAYGSVGGSGNSGIQDYVNSLPIGTSAGTRWKDSTPLNLGAGLGTYNWRGRRLTVNRSAANNFIGFLEALHDRGYNIHTLYSYANRNIAGTNRKSLHAYGLAIDINPAQNPVTWNGKVVTDMPRGVGRLAAKYGLAWGGNWNGSKRDTMHFSIPAYGTK